MDPAALDLSDHIRPGDTVAWSQACAEPVTLTRLLMQQRGLIGGRFRALIGYTLADVVQPEHADVVSFVSYTGSGRNRALADAGVLDILPSPYSHFPALFVERKFPVDVVLLQLPPAGPDGRHSLGLADDYIGDALATARVVIAEVNERAPATTSTRTIGPEQLDAVISTSTPPVELPGSDVSPAEERIAQLVAGLVPDGATVQVGLGSLPAAMAGGLVHHRHLGIHSGGMFDAMVDLIEAGAVTNARKPIDRGITVAGILMGSRRLFDFAHRNPEVVVRSASYTHDPEVLAALPQFVALNSAVEVDLTGQINAEVINGSYRGAVGGAADFLRAASRSHGGLPIVALPSTAGLRSRIVHSLDGPVSTTRSDAGIVVTEHGSADLRGRTIAERIEQMLAIADPGHRDRLACAADARLTHPATGGS